jgi:hypothetical protein
MSQEAWPSGAWYYRQAGEACGPVSAERLKELLAAGQLRAGQAVWRRSRERLLFVQAARAASGAAGDGSGRPGSGPAPA